MRRQDWVFLELGCLIAALVAVLGGLFVSSRTNNPQWFLFGYPIGVVLCFIGRHANRKALHDTRR